jgi:hypothetical protein
MQRDASECQWFSWAVVNLHSDKCRTSMRSDERNHPGEPTQQVSFKIASLDLGLCLRHHRQP